MYQEFLNWFESLLVGSNDVMLWLTTQISVGGWNFTPLAILTFGGLTAYLVLAVVKWAVS